MGGFRNCYAIRRSQAYRDGVKSRKASGIEEGPSAGTVHATPTRLEHCGNERPISVERVLFLEWLLIRTAFHKYERNRLYETQYLHSLAQPKPGGARTSVRSQRERNKFRAPGTTAARAEVLPRKWKSTPDFEQPIRRWGAVPIARRNQNQLKANFER